MGWGRVIEICEVVLAMFSVKGYKGCCIYAPLISQLSQLTSIGMSIDRVIMNYVLQEEIGSGQYGNVYRAQHKLEAGLFAVKVMSIEVFKQEPKLSEFTDVQMSVLAKINHPNIIKFKEMLKNTSNIYLVYEYCDGGTLSQFIKQRGKVPEPDALKLFQQIRQAYFALYQARILHRDLKPTNILFKDGVIKLADFGFCKELLKEGDMAQTIVGSPIYMAPEILRALMYDSKADIWSLGVILYEMLYGVCPYEQTSIPKLLSVIETCYIKFPEEPEISSNIKHLIKKMLTITPKNRMGATQLNDYDLYKEIKEDIVVNYQVAAKYLRRAFIYLTQTLEILCARIDQLTYLRLAFLISKVINAMQKDTMSTGIFWENLKIKVKEKAWDNVLLQQNKILEPFAQQTKQVFTRQDTSLKAKVELETPNVDAKFFLESLRRVQDPQLTIRLYNCLLYNKHFCLVKQKRYTDWVDPQKDGLSLKEKAELLFKYARYY